MLTLLAHLWDSAAGYADRHPWLWDLLELLLGSIAWLLLGMLTGVIYSNFTTPPSRQPEPHPTTYQAQPVVAPTHAPGVARFVCRSVLAHRDPSGAVAHPVRFYTGKGCGCFCVFSQPNLPEGLA